MRSYVLIMAFQQHYLMLVENKSFPGIPNHRGVNGATIPITGESLALEITVLQA